MKKTAPAPSANPIPYPQTPESAAAYIRNHGLCLSELARDRNLPRMAFVDLLRGRGKWCRGASHLAAIALGLKPNPNGRRSS